MLAFIDTFGGGYVELAIQLGVAPARIDTIIDFAAAAKCGVKTEGSFEAANADVLGQLAGLIAAGRLEIPIRSPYPIVGGRLFCALVKQGDSPLDQAEIFFGEPRWNNGDLYSYVWGKGTENLEIDLDPSFLKHGVLYNYSIGFTLRGNAKSNPPTQAGVNHFHLVTDLQVSPHSLPALSLGKNLIHYWDGSTGPNSPRSITPAASVILP